MPKPTTILPGPVRWRSICFQYRWAIFDAVLGDLAALVFRSRLKFFRLPEIRIAFVAEKDDESVRGRRFIFANDAVNAGRLSVREAGQSVHRLEVRAARERHPFPEE